ncbi:GIN domain-containing protein [Pontibacter silvestris]|uniref:GIN domain-containing protein n=1 Tax=Pontibacter silvestris TaxID=2305183 RepID=A0ABW4WSB2_9BACT|nr:DUF2807 domain-containing protein [Pontibacter silvestris]MCC9136282.1 DUF2807 domain-containing protein [Pontibacter silvestris]
MKKNISINLQGIIFHIEEDGYEQLSRYLASIRTYFSNYEGHEEIIADIEARIAEIFSARLSPGKQVITMEDVQYLITRMGNVTDFEVVEPVEAEMPPYSATDTTTGTNPETETETEAGPEEEAYSEPRHKKLYRDINRKVIGGVCAGLANYLNIDIVWVRLFFLFLLFVIAPLTAGISAAPIVIIYIILWIALPESAHLPETKVKRLYRDPEDKKLAGIASGLGKYFGVDVSVVRILFLASVLLGGSGVIIYIILWVAVPEAVTLTERMQMQGDPVTLAGIEKMLRDNLNMKGPDGEESTLAKIILLPVRLVSQLFTWLGHALGPILAFLITLIRVGAGIFLLLLSIGLTIALLSTFFVSLGLVDVSYFDFNDFPASVYIGGFPRLGLVAGFVVGLIPILLLFFLGVALLSKRFFLRPIVGWSMFGVWLVSLCVMIATIVMFSNNFRRSGEVLTTKTIPVSAYGSLTLDAYDTNNSYDHIYVDVREHNGQDVEVIQRVEARGRTEEEAQRNAHMVSYRVIQRDSVIRFDNSYEFRRGAVYRDQDLEITLMLPKNKKLRLTRGFVHMLPGATFDRDYSTSKIVRNTWQVKGDMLECLTCASDTISTDEDSSYDNSDSDIDINLTGLDIGSSVLLDEDAYSSNSETFNFNDFEEITVSGPYHVQLKQGDNYSIRVRGERSDLRRLKIDQDENELNIGYTEKSINLFDNREPILVQITAPNIRKIDLSGAIKADVGNLTANDLEVNLSGATKAVIDVRVQNLKVDIAGASASSFTGTTETLELDASGACKIEAEELRANSVDIEVSGVAVANVYATNTLRANASGASKIEYRGTPANVTIDTSGPSKISRR